MSTNSAYFTALDTALKAAGTTGATLVIDRDRLDANLDLLLQDIPKGMALRVVAKSLPCPALLARVMDRARTDRLMTFNLPMLRQIADQFPKARQMLGKPLSDAAIEAFVASDPRPHGVTWLIDSPERMARAASIVGAKGATLDVALELDIGLHRGGMAPGAELASALDILRAAPQLRFAGLMGYEPHIPKIPTLFGWRDRLLARAWDGYRAARTQVIDALGPEATEGAIYNAGGSPTYRLYSDLSVANELAAGSVLLKPSDFDTPLLADHQPAVFIAAPVLKGPIPTRMPGLEALPVRPSRAQTVFIQGGKWMATPVHPAGLQPNPTYGRSSNQEMLNGRHIPMAAGDFVMLRPTQSEAILTHFGPIAIYADGKIVDHWDVFPASA